MAFYLAHKRTEEATALSHEYRELEYFPHALEMLLHTVLDEEADTSPPPEEAVLPRVLSLLSTFPEYLDVVLQCTRKTEARQWKTLFAYLPPAQELFEESLQRGSLKTAGGYLLVLHTLDELDAATEQPVRLLTQAMKVGDWDLCKELARFLVAMDNTGEVLREVMRMADVSLAEAGGSGTGALTASRGRTEATADRLEIPSARMAQWARHNSNGHGNSHGQGNGGSTTGSDVESDRRSVSDGVSLSSANGG